MIKFKQTIGEHVIKIVKFQKRMLTNTPFPTYSAISLKKLNNRKVQWVTKILHSFFGRINIV